MPTISELPPATSVSAADEIPISQSGSSHSASVGILLASMQPAITIGSQSLLGRISLGPGGPEQVDVGIGVAVSNGTLSANGLDHATYPMMADFSASADLVISNQGSAMLMATSMLRGLFSAGQNVSIDSQGVISSSSSVTSGGLAGSSSSIGALQVISTISDQDLVPVSHGGINHAIAYEDFLDGVTIDAAGPSGPVNSADRLWVSQGNSIMTGQTFAAIWLWITQSLPSYRLPSIEITTNITLDAGDHNGHCLICSQPITITPSSVAMGSGFHCTILNASSGNVMLGSGFISSTGNLSLLPWQNAGVSCLTYSGGTVVFAAMPQAASTVAAPG